MYTMKSPTTNPKHVYGRSFADDEVDGGESKAGAVEGAALELGVSDKLSLESREFGNEGRDDADSTEPFREWEAV